METTINKEKKTDLFKIDPRAIDVQEGFNARNDYGDIESLRDSIIENGVEVPLKVYRNAEEKGRYILVDGHRRHRATMMAIEGGADIAYVPARMAERNSNQESRLFDMIITNDGKPLTTYEQGVVYNRLLSYGYNQSEIAKKVGKSAALVGNAIRLATAPKVIRDYITQDMISSSLAIQILRDTPNEVDQIRAIRTAVKSAETKNSGDATKKVRVTAKDIQTPKKPSTLSLMQEVLAEFEPNNENQREKLAMLSDFVTMIKSKATKEQILSLLSE